MPSTFRSVLPHEPIPQEEFGYIHVHGTFEPKTSKKPTDSLPPLFTWSREALQEAVAQSPIVKKAVGLRDIEVMDAESPFSKIRLTTASPKDAHFIVVEWRRLQMTPSQLLAEFASNAKVEEQLQFTTKQLQITQLTTLPMLPTTVAWTRSNPPKFRRLLHTNNCTNREDTLSLDEQRRQARFVFISNLIPSDTKPPSEWCGSHVILQAIRHVLDPYDSSGNGVEVFIPHKSIPYTCHVGMRAPKDAQAVIAAFNGKKIQWNLSQMLPQDDSSNVMIESGKLFLDYADITQRSETRARRTLGQEVERGEPSKSECTSTTNAVAVPGLILIENYMTEEEEKVLMAALMGPHAPWAPSQVTPSKTGVVRRKVQHYGYVFDYESADVLRDRNQPSSACPPMPCLGEKKNNDQQEQDLEALISGHVKEGRGWHTLAGISERTRNVEFSNGSQYRQINQMTVNVYRPGEGIGAHVDTLSAFGDGLISISLNGGIVMEFRHVTSKEKKLLYLPARSLLLMSGPARYEWEHMIVSRMTDTHNGQVVPRRLRVSLTLRTGLKLPEHGATPLPIVESCKFPPRWGASTTHDSPTPKPLATPDTEREHVHAVYDAIATQWHHTRGKRGVLWPGATQFLQQLPPSSLVADVGCGDGKYFPAIWNAGSFVIGTDISLPLLLTSVGASSSTDAPVNRQVREELAHLRDRPAVAVGDCINIPLRDNSMDAAICIAVMHHLSTEERRIRCIQEVARVVSPGGLINIQAWAMEQEDGSRRKFASTDVFVPFNAQPKYLDLSSAASDGSQSVAQMYSRDYKGAEYDERKGLVVFQRYCHMYRKGELEDLASRAGAGDLVEAGYESGNHYIILKVK